MSVVSLPRRLETVPRSPEVRAPRRATHQAPAPRRAVVKSRWRATSTTRRAVIVLGIGLAVSLGGSMFEANRQVQLHQLQTQLLQVQSSYAEQVGAMTNISSPGQVAAQAGIMHLVDPVSLTQVPSTSLDAPLSLPKFLGYAPVTSRTNR